MEKNSTPAPSSSCPAIAATPRRSTIERIRQLARATFPTPFGAPIVLN